MGPLSGVENLTPDHDTAQFDCGKRELSEWLDKHALQSEGAKSARTYVVHRDKRVVGYFSLATGSVMHADATPRIGKGLARTPIPVILLARLAVDVTEQGSGLGAALLKEALLRALQASDTVGARAVLVHAIDDEARRFYERFGFENSPTDPRHLFILMKDLRQWVSETSDG